MIHQPYYYSQKMGEYWLHFHETEKDCDMFCRRITFQEWNKAIEKISGVKRQVFHEDEKAFKKRSI